MIRIKPFRDVNRKLDDAYLNDGDSKRIGLFFSVMMISLFMINTSDIISELAGWGLSQRSFSAAFKGICAIYFLNCIPAVIRSFSIAELIVVMASAIVIVLSLLLFNNAQVMDTIITYVSMCLTSFIAANTLRDYSLLKKYLIKTSRVVAVLGILLLILSSLGIVSSLRTGGYRMGLGYACITCVMFLLWSFVEKRNVADLFGVTGLTVMVFLYGSRGPLVGIVLFLVFFGVRYFHKKGQDIVSFLILIVSLVTIISFSELMKLVNRVLATVNVTSRNLHLFISQRFSYDAGRNKIWNIIVSEILGHPFKVRGINAEYTIVNTYAHNIIIELVYQFGIIIGGIALLFIFSKVFNTLLLDVDTDASVICLIFMFACIPSLMFSGSLWTVQNFWIWLALIVSYKRGGKKGAVLHNTS